jgi:ABC-type transporter Mla MlaB component
MLAFTLTNENRAIEIDCDDAGIDALVGVLLSLKGSGSHIHLRAANHSQDKLAQLSSVTPWGDPAVAEVIISHGGD